MTKQPTLIRLLTTKNSAIADVICWLAQNANADGIVEDCTLTEVIARSGKSKDAIIAAFQILEDCRYGRREGENFRFSMRKFFPLFEIPEPAARIIIDVYLFLSDEIDAMESISECNYSYKLRKENQSH